MQQHALRRWCPARLAASAVAAAGLRQFLQPCTCASKFNKHNGLPALLCRFGASVSIDMLELLKSMAAKADDRLTAEHADDSLPWSLDSVAVRTIGHQKASGARQNPAALSFGQGDDFLSFLKPLDS